MARHSAVVAAAILLAACLMPLAVSGARSVKKTTGSNFVVVGTVFCEPCCAGFETTAATRVARAKVRVECKTRATGAETCTFEGVTDETGTYRITVADEHEHENCESVLVESPDEACSKKVRDRERAPVFLTHNNGIASDTRYANALGFERDSPMEFCGSVMAQYLELNL